MQAVQLNLLLFHQMSKPMTMSVGSPCKDLISCGGCQEEFPLDELLLFLSHKASCSARLRPQVSSSSPPPPKAADAETNTCSNMEGPSGQLTCVQCRERLETADELLEHMRTTHGGSLASPPASPYSVTLPSYQPFQYRDPSEDFKIRLPPRSTDGIEERAQDLSLKPPQSPMSDEKAQVTRRRWTRQKIYELLLPRSIPRSRPCRSTARRSEELSKSRRRRTWHRPPHSGLQPAKLLASPNLKMCFRTHSF